MGLGKFKFRYKKYLKIGDVIIEILKKNLVVGNSINKFIISMVFEIWLFEILKLSCAVID